MTNVILCGGVGSRLWPLSRTCLPKQFARMLPGDSLFEATVRRNRGLADRVLVASNREQSFLAANQLRGLGIREWKSVVEPMGRNTAPAIALACLMLPADELVLVTPSDHAVSRDDAYRAAVERAMRLAGQGKLVTFGIKPEYPETGFGYIQTGGDGGEQVVSFHEKPDPATAGSFVASGRYWWNSGMFCFAAGVFLAELEAHAPAVYAAARTAWSNAVQKEPLQPGENDMYAIPSVSIDRAVMEKSANVACVVCDLGWSDLGSFDALYGHVRHDADGNALAGAMDPVVVDSRNNLVISGERVVSLVDVEDLLVVESPDALLVAKRGSSQKVKDVVEVLKARRSGATETFPRVERPWGSYTVLHDAADCKVKRIEVAPGQRLSLHRHLQREEHWTVVSGAALVQVEKSRKYLTAGQTIMVPQHAFHRLENSGAVPTIVIETEIGSYLGEDDIERIQDDYV